MVMTPFPFRSVNELEMGMVIPRHPLIGSDLSDRLHLGLIENPAEEFVCGINTAVMVFDAEPHLVTALLHQGSEPPCLEVGRS